MEAKAFAFFDFDGTLCQGDSILPYLLYAVKHGLAPKQQLLHALKGYIRQKLHPDQVVYAKELTLSFIKDKAQAEMDEFACSFIRDVLVPCFFAEGLQEINKLRQQGVHVVIVSASPDVYMRMLPAFLPVDDVIATPCEKHTNGTYSGSITCNCKGDEKPQLIRAWLLQHGWTLDRDASSAFGDSYSDAPMLKQVGHPVLVNPKQKLIKAMPQAKVVHWHAKSKE